VTGLDVRRGRPRRDQQEGGEEREHRTNLTPPVDKLQLSKKNVSVR
jgi:hypothetical protein